MSKAYTLTIHCDTMEELTSVLHKQEDEPPLVEIEAPATSETEPRRRGRPAKAAPASTNGKDAPDLAKAKLEAFDLLQTCWTTGPKAIELINALLPRFGVTNFRDLPDEHVVELLAEMKKIKAQVDKEPPAAAVPGPF